MGLYYPNQTTRSIIGSKTAANVLTAVTLTDYYDLDGTASKSFTTGDNSKIELIGQYTAGASETLNSLQLIIESSTDGTNWYRVLNESVSNGTSTLTLREFTIVQTTTYGKLAYDAQSANFTAGLKVTDAGGGSGYIEADTDAGTTGTLTISNITAPFVNDQALTDSGSGAAVTNGILQSVTNFSLPLDISNEYIRVSAKETGKASNFGTLFMEVTQSGR